jgi:chitinase
MAAQIEACQAKGKIVTLALGGSISQVGLASDALARDFADKTWHSFLGGSDSDSPRPFGDAVLDGYAFFSIPFPFSRLLCVSVSVSVLHHP